MPPNAAERGSAERELHVAAIYTAVYYFCVLSHLGISLEPAGEYSSLSAALTLLVTLPTKTSAALCQIRLLPPVLERSLSAWVCSFQLLQDFVLTPMIMFQPLLRKLSLFA